MKLKRKIRPGRRLPAGVRTALAVFLLIFISAASIWALDVPPLKGRVNDYAGMISPQTRQVLETKLAALEKSDSTQLVILTIPSLEGESLEEFSIKVAETWGLGQAELDNGVLFLVAKEERKVRLEVGYGLEGALTDLLAGRIIDYEIVPRFKAGELDAGFIQGVEAVTAAVRGEYKPPERKPGRDSGGSGWFFVLFMPFLVVTFLAAHSRILGAVAGAVFFPIIAWLVWSLGFLTVLLFIPLGFILGLLAPLFWVFSGGGGHYRSGGFVGGGFSGGGGGFSGGGGGFGGGGASGSW